MASQVILALLVAISGSRPCVAQLETPPATDVRLIPARCGRTSTEPDSGFGFLGRCPAAIACEQGVETPDGQTETNARPAGPVGFAPSSRDDEVVLPSPSPAPGSAAVQAGSGSEPFSWQLMPQGLLYPAYLAGPVESRFGTEWAYQRNRGPILDSSLGAHIGVLRYGQEDGLSPDGSQWDFEGTAFPRLELSDATELVSTDYRFGTLDTFRRGPWEAKFGYYHLCSHLGDTYLEENPLLYRISYVRDSLVLGGALRPRPDLRFYCEIGYAVHVTGDAQPWETQFGGEFVRATAATAWWAVHGRQRPPAGREQLRRNSDHRIRLGLAVGGSTT